MKKTMRKIIALITMCLVLAFPLNTYAAPGGLHKPRRTYEQALEHFEEIKNKQVHIRFSHRGLYVAKESGIPVHHPISIGQGFRGKEISGIGIGNCCLGADFCAEGCPPTAKAVEKMLRELS